MTMENSGYDLYFTIPAINDGTIISVITNINVSPDPSAGVTNTILQLAREGSRYTVLITNTNNKIYEIFLLPSSVSTPKDIRIFAHNLYLSVYVNGVWVHTFYFAQIVYPEYSDQTITLKVTGQALTITNIRVVELFDWREAVYADLDSFAMNALSTVIQSRPVEINPDYSGKLKFIYSNDSKRSLIALYPKLTKSITITDDASGVMSDAVVYASQVQIVVNKIAAALFGFITRMIRVPELDNGAKRAAEVISNQEVQKAKEYTIVMRGDIRVEYGDIVTFTYHLSSTGSAISGACIVESCSIESRDGVFETTIKGRNYYD